MTATNMCSNFVGFRCGSPLVRNIHDQLAQSHISCFIIILNFTTGETCEADNDVIVAFLVSKTGQ